MSNIDSSDSSVSTLSVSDIAKAAAFNLYCNGSDARQQKNGNPDNLVTNAVTCKTVCSIGVYKWYLSAEDRAIINDKKKCHEYSFISKMSKIILSAAGVMFDPISTKDVKVFVHIPSQAHFDMLTALAKNKFESYKEKEIINNLSPRKMFIYQERQKVDG